eukprot:GHVP01010239.1.p1 GENE.GHVP01010239.1~~GHVP01010239.1.p1  ORF type:complete len:1357 (+),score=306.38 GHVP01010239.1:3-4073(+)
METISDYASPKQFEYLFLTAKGVYLKCRIINSSDAGVMIECEDGEIKHTKSEDLQERNPELYYMSNDISDMPCLTEGTVYENLRTRYLKENIYTYSGLFLVAINPYKDLSLYTQEKFQEYRESNLTEKAPHIFAITEKAYRQLCTEKRNQSILITGESGAGKTENTKRAIQYIAYSAGSQGDNLDHQLLLSTQILESFGNAQTIRNNNSSRFGKYVKIDLVNGRITGARIEKYLFEKSRVTKRASNERNFHIFYQLIVGLDTETKKEFMLTSSPDDYFYTSTTNNTNIDDLEGYNTLIKGLTNFGFDQKEIYSCFKTIAGILHLGNVIVEESPQEVRIISEESFKNACDLLGIERTNFEESLLRPKAIAGREVVVIEQTIEQVRKSLCAFSRTLFEFIFDFILQRINTILDQTTIQGNSIGILDISGFEIFQKNLLEQLCINHTNERLQQFFNHRMFIMEQEEYKREGIEWSQEDFGLDSLPVLNLLEQLNPPGLLALLDEDCVMPGATDSSLLQKIKNCWNDKSEKLTFSKFGKTFTINHYAGEVEYITEDWLEKNKDPINESLIDCLGVSTDSLLSSLFGKNNKTINKSSRYIKKGIFRTVTQKHKESLLFLMEGLSETSPHFVRCVVPNNNKRPDEINPSLILDQIKCNGILEGVRIYKKGYPNKLDYESFYSRYLALGRGWNTDGVERVSSTNQDSRKWTIDFISNSIHPSQYKIGKNRVFFRAGILAVFENMRDGVLMKSKEVIQRYLLSSLSQKKLSNMLYSEKNIVDFQDEVRRCLIDKSWRWTSLYKEVLSLVDISEKDDENKKIRESLCNLENENMQKSHSLKAKSDEVSKLKHENKRLERELNELSIQLRETNDKKDSLILYKMDKELETIMLEERLRESERGLDKYNTLADEIARLILNDKIVESETYKSIEHASNKSDPNNIEKDTISTDIFSSEQNDYSTRTESPTKEDIINNPETLLEIFKEVLEKKSEQSGKIMKLTNQLEELKESTEKHLNQEESHIMKERHAGIVKKYTSKIGQLEEELKNMKDKTIREINTLNGEIEGVRAHNTFLMEEKNKKEALNEEHLEDINSKKAMIKHLEKELKKKEASPPVENEFIKGLETDNKKYQMKIEELTAEKKKLKLDLYDVETELLVTKKECVTIIRKSQDLEEDFSMIKGESDEYKEKIKELQVKVDTVVKNLQNKEDELFIITEKLKASERLYRSVLVINKEVYSKSIEKDNEIIRNKEIIKGLKLKLIDYETTKGDKRKVDDMKELHEILKEIENDTIERQELQKENRIIKRNLKESEERYKELEEQKNKSIKEIIDLRDKAKALNQAAIEFEKRDSERIREIRILEMKLMSN